MSASPVALTVAGGGINRLRVKGAALKNSLYMLENGYVSMAQTVKVRPGTFRHTNLAADSDTAGKTFGLTWFEESFHVFAAEEVPIPDGYTLHVLNHPAATQEVITPTELVVTIDTAIAFGSTCNGYSDGSNSGPIMGSVSPDHVGTSVANTAYTSTNGSVQNLIITLDGGLLTQDAFDSVEDVESGITYNTADASGFAHGSGGTNLWQWLIVTPWPTSGTRHLIFRGGIADGSATPVIESIPLKEIHFAAPFMGFLYVAAEFDVSQAPAAAALGDTFHYWIQTSGEWKADTVYQIGQIVSPTVPNGFQYQAARISPANPVWTPSTIVAMDSIVEPTVPNGYYFTAVEVDGANPMTGILEPTWPTASGGIVAENSAQGGNDVVATAAPQPSTDVPTPGTGGKYTNPYSGPGSLVVST